MTEEELTKFAWSLANMLMIRGNRLPNGRMPSAEIDRAAADVAAELKRRFPAYIDSTS